MFDQTEMKTVIVVSTDCYDDHVVGWCRRSLSNGTGFLMFHGE